MRNRFLIFSVLFLSILTGCAQEDDAVGKGYLTGAIVTVVVVGVVIGLYRFLRKR